MGSKGMKRRRKGGNRQHLEQATAGNVRHEQELEREAVADVMGFGEASGWLRWAVIVVITLIVLIALITWIAIL